VVHRYYDLATKIHVAEAGDPSGPPLVALHGFPQTWYEWRRLIPLLEEFRFLAPDLRGLGESGPADDYRKAAIAEDVIDHLDIEQAMLVGHDWGGWAGFHAVLKAPERFTGFVASGTAHPWLSRRTTLEAAPRFLYQPPIAAPFFGPMIIPALVPRILRAGWGDRSTYDQEAERVYAAAYRKPGKAEAASRYYRDFLVKELLRGPVGELKVPTRLLQGRKDPIGTAVASGLERHGGKTILLDGCGHFVPEERPQDVADAVRELAGL
jgi:pimeloyl-ACP methyl ester carboxylesterase